MYRKHKIIPGQKAVFFSFPASGGGGLARLIDRHKIPIEILCQIG